MKIITKNEFSQAQKMLSFEEIQTFFEKHYLKNRTIVSKDIPAILEDIEQLTGLPLLRHRFASGEDHGTWIIPPRWDVKEAWLKDCKGRTVASYADHPLFVCPYSKAVHQKLSKAELLPHVSFEPKQPGAFAYNWRYANHAKMRLKEWGISLPKNIIDKLDDGPFEIFIDTEVEDGEMIVGEIVLPGKSSEAIIFVADYCHPGQVNDSFSGLGMFMKVMNTLAHKSRRHFTYRFLVLPETIGSAAYIAQDPSRVKNVVGTIFADSVAWGGQWYIKLSRQGNTLMDVLAVDCQMSFKDVELCQFSGALKNGEVIFNNDEIIFDSVQVNIPSLSVQKYPFDEYHTSNDTPGRVKESELAFAHDLVMHMADILEKDAVYRFTHPVPFWMSRFDLYSDALQDYQQYRFKFDIVYRYLDGKRSILEIAQLLNVPFKAVFDFIKKMEQNDLVKVIQANPWRSFNPKGSAC